MTPTMAPIGTRRGSNPQVTTPRRHGFSPLPQSISDSKWSNAVQPPLLFGSGTGDAPSIWSTTHDPGIASNIGAPTAPPLSTPTLPTMSRSPITSRPIPGGAPYAHTRSSSQFDVPFEVNSPTNFVSSGALRGLSMPPPYGFVQPPVPIMDQSTSHSQPTHLFDSYQPIAPPTDYYQPTRQYRDWAPPP